MKIKTTIAKTTGQFVIRTYINNEVVALDGSIDPHLLHLPEPQDGWKENYKYLIYPDKDHPDQYRLIVVSHPNHYIHFDSSAHLVPMMDDDHQRYEFQYAPKPTSASNKDEEWFYFHGVGVNYHFDFSTIRYVGPSDNDHDRAKLRFEMIDVVQPDEKKVVMSKPGEMGWDDAPKDNEKINGVKTKPKVISVEAIPAALIEDKDFRNKVHQMTMNPYYYLKWEKYWSAEGLMSIPLSHETSIEKEVKFRSSFSSSDYESVKKTVGHTFDVSLNAYIKKTGEVKVDEGDGSASDKTEVGGSVKLAYQYKNQTETLRGRNQNQSSSIEITETIHFDKLDSSESKKTAQFWVPVELFTLTNGEGDVVKQWTHTTADKRILQFTKA